MAESQRWVSLGLGTVSFSRMSSDRRNRLAVELTRSHTNLARVAPSGEIQPVTLGAGADFDPAVASDGTVAHVSNRSGSYEIWIATLAGSGIRFADHYVQNGPRITDIDVWTVGVHGIYIRRGRRVHQPSSIWLYPWNQPGRKLTDAPLAAGDVGIDTNGNVIFSQTLDQEVDLGMIELRGRT